MKKRSLALLALVASSLASAVPTSSTLILPGGGNLSPAGTLNLPLAPLSKGVYYNLSCQVSNPQAEAVDLRFEPSPGLGSGYGQVTLDETVLDNLQGSVQNGLHTVAVHDLSVGNGAAFLQFKNLDFNNRVEVSNCIAKPAIHNARLQSGGFFIAYNDTNNFVEVKVGTFIPVPYTISPHSNRWVFVSTDNQNLTISKIF